MMRLAIVTRYWSTMYVQTQIAFAPHLFAYSTQSPPKALRACCKIE